MISRRRLQTQARLGSRLSWSLRLEYQPLLMHLWDRKMRIQKGPCGRQEVGEEGVDENL